MLDKFLFREEWILAIRRRSKNLLFEQGGTEDKFSIIPNSVRYWCADPFIIKHNNRSYIFFEMYDRRRLYGVIGYREIYDVDSFSEMKIAIDCGHHLSYPNIFEKDGEIYIIPESYLAKCIQAYKAVSFPDKWERCEILVSDIVACDTTFIDDNHMITMQYPPYPNGIAVLFEKNKGVWEKVPNNPIDTDPAHLRCGGKIFSYNGALIRPAQNGIGGYGRGINFRKINKYGNNEYSEETILEISAEDIKHNGPRQYDGVHTYNFDDDYEVIDLKIEKAFNLINIIMRYYGKAYRLFKRIVRK